MPRELTPEEKAAFTRQEQERRQSLAGGMTPRPSRPSPSAGAGPTRPEPSDAEFLKMWQGRNQTLQQQRGREGERREFEKGRPMLPSGASDIRRPTGPLRPGRAQGETVYDWEERVRQAEEALRAAQGAAGR